VFPLPIDLIAPFLNAPEHEGVGPSRRAVARLHRARELLSRLAVR